jgi:hypothetical protein
MEQRMAAQKGVERVDWRGKMLAVSMEQIEVGVLAAHWDFCLAAWKVAMMVDLMDMLTAELLDDDWVVVKE